MVIPQHKHLIVRAECNSYPNSESQVESFLTDIVSALEMKILSGPHVSYVDVGGNRGATGVVVIETSHCAIHIWDEVSPALIQLDIYTCGELDPEVIFHEIRNRFDPVKFEYKYLDREHGLQELSAGSEGKNDYSITGLSSEA